VPSYLLQDTRWVGIPFFVPGQEEKGQAQIPCGNDNRESRGDNRESRGDNRESRGDNKKSKGHSRFLRCATE
jgi:hypothetical protein